MLLPPLFSVSSTQFVVQILDDKQLSCTEFMVRNVKQAILIVSNHAIQP